MKVFFVYCCKCESYSFVILFVLKIDAKWRSPSFVLFFNWYDDGSVDLGLFNILMISETNCCKKESIVTVGIGFVCGIKWNVLHIISLFVDGT